MGGQEKWHPSTSAAAAAATLGNNEALGGSVLSTMVSSCPWNISCFSATYFLCAPTCSLLSVTTTKGNVSICLWWGYHSPGTWEPVICSWNEHIFIIIAYILSSAFIQGVQGGNICCSVSPSAPIFILRTPLWDGTVTQSQLGLRGPSEFPSWAGIWTQIRSILL